MPCFQLQPSQYSQGDRTLKYQWNMVKNMKLETCILCVYMKVWDLLPENPHSYQCVILEGTRYVSIAHRCLHIYMITTEWYIWPQSVESKVVKRLSYGSITFTFGVTRDIVLGLWTSGHKQMSPKKGGGIIGATLWYYILNEI